MTIAPVTESVAGGGRALLSESLFDDAPPARSGLDLLAPTLAMSGVCIATVLGASAVHRGSPWSGINAIASGLGLIGDRPPKRFEPRLAATSLGIVLGGSLVAAAVQRKLVGSLGRNRVGIGLTMAIGAFAMDRFLMRRTLIPALVHALGPAGTVLKYAMIGAAAAIAGIPARQSE